MTREAGGFGWTTRPPPTTERSMRGRRTRSTSRVAYSPAAIVSWWRMTSAMMKLRSFSAKAGSSLAFSASSRRRAICWPRGPGRRGAAGAGLEVADLLGALEASASMWTTAASMLSMLSRRRASSAVTSRRCRYGALGRALGTAPLASRGGGGGGKKKKKKKKKKGTSLGQGRWISPLDEGVDPVPRTAALRHDPGVTLPGRRVVEGISASSSWESVRHRASGGPWATTSTRPSTVLRAWPTSPSSRARARVHHRKPTPCRGPRARRKWARTGGPPHAAVCSIAHTV